MKLCWIFLLFFAMSCPLYAQWDAEQKLKELKIELPPAGKPIANYVKFVRTVYILYLAAAGPVGADGSWVIGVLGKDLTVEQGYEAARLTGIQMISTLKDALGDLNKVKRVVKVLGIVRCTDDFTDQPKVLNGFSDLMVAVFGENGKHARSAVGTNALPGGISMEIEMIIEVQ